MSTQSTRAGARVASMRRSALATDPNLMDSSSTPETAPPVARCAVVARLFAHAAFAAIALIVATMKLAPDVRVGIYSNPPRAAMRYSAFVNPQWIALACAMLSFAHVLDPPGIRVHSTAGPGAGTATSISGFAWAVELATRGSQAALVLLLTDDRVPVALLGIAVWISGMQVVLHIIRVVLPDKNQRRATVGTLGALLLTAAALTITARSHAHASRTFSRTASATVGIAMGLKALDSFLRMAHPLPFLSDATRDVLMVPVDIALQGTLTLAACTLDV